MVIWPTRHSLKAAGRRGEAYAERGSRSSDSDRDRNFGNIVWI